MPPKTSGGIRSEVKELQVSNEKSKEEMQELKGQVTEMKNQLTQQSEIQLKMLETLERLENQSREQKSAPVIKSTPSGKEFKFDKKDYTRKQTKTIRDLVLKSKKDISYDEDKLTDDEDKTYWIDLCLEHKIPPPSVKSKKEKDPNAPKKALNIYMTFCQHYREKYPDQKFSTSEIQEKYRSLTQEEKKEYLKLVEKDKKRYESEMEKYKSSQDNTSSDSDSVSEKHLSAKPPSGRHKVVKKKKNRKPNKQVFEPEPEPEPEPQFEVVPDSSDDSSSESSDENSDFEEAPPKKPISHPNLLDMSVEA